MPVDVGAKLAIATVVAMLKVALGQIRKLAISVKHEKIDAAIEKLEHAIAELEDCALEKKKPG